MTRIDSSTRLKRRVFAALAYPAMIGAAIGAFFIVRQMGADLVPPSGSAPLPAAGPKSPPLDTLLHVLLALVVILVAARVVGMLFERISQPPVIGEVFAGIMLGPSLLGRVAPDVAAFLLPPTIAPLLSVVAQVGVILYMFLVGLELDTTLLRSRTHTSVVLSHTSIIVPFVLGAALALWLYPRFSVSGVPFTVFALFMGVSMSVTAFPVLARILTERRMQGTQLGAITLACAAVDDVTAWCLLAFVVSVVKADPGKIVVTLSLALGFIAIMLVPMRLAARRLVQLRDQQGQLTRGMFAAVCVALLLSALATEAIGIHALFGAFLLGAIVPHGSAFARDVASRLEDIVIVLLLPVYFAFTGMRTQIGLIEGREQWLACGLIILVASAGKFGGSALVARLASFDWRDAAAIGVLMNTRGLMELIVLNLGYDLGVLPPTLFAMFVIMALVTTFATSPILAWLGVVPDPKELAVRAAA